VRSAHESGITVIPIPGPAAAVAALSASGLFSGRFCFEGFLPTNRKTRQARLLAIMDEQRTLLFYEAPHKLKNTLRDLLNHLGDRETVVARELTKIHEEIVKTTLSAALHDCEQTEPRGEYVLVVAGRPSDRENEYTMEDAVAMAKALTEDGFSPSAAARAAAKETGFPRSELYRAVIHD
ncbi:MAG: SAM-dependent methyltransferase, partial [Oscillospiraceae bacterium]|nr:SAM-dependent methyltransferase [Oscillospiraceae bacterium]